MAKIAKPGSSTVASKTSKGLQAGPSSYKVVGSTSDGVKILAPKTKATHFTFRQIRSAIAEVRGKTATGTVPPQEIKE